MKNYEEALEIIKREFAEIKLSTEEHDLYDSINRIIAENVAADIDLPPFDNSAVDGYAISYSNKKEWKIIGEVSAGNSQSYLVKAEEAVLITTGSKIPKSTDTVIPIEDVDVDGSILKLKKNAIIKKGMNIRYKGSELDKNQIAVQQYTKIDSKVISVLASCGIEKAKVFKKLQAAILATGDELIPVNEKPKDDKIRVSNIYSLYAAIEELHQTPISLGFIKDSRELLQQKIKEVLDTNIDLLITTGGVSVGKYDFLKEIFNELGVSEKFWKVNIKPGKPIYFGVYSKNNSRTLVFGLPGNPVSSLVNFNIFIKPAIEFLYNLKTINSITAILSNKVKKKDSKRHFSRGILIQEGKEWKVISKFSQSSGNLVEMSKSNCLIEIEEDKRDPSKGDSVTCILI